IQRLSVLITGNGHIHKTVVVVVCHRDDASVVKSRGGIHQASAIGHVRKGAIPVILAQAIHPGKVLHKQVQLAVIIVIEEDRAATAIDGNPNSRLSSGVLKRSIAQTSEQFIALGLGSLYGALGNVKIELAIPIEITKREAVPI